MLVRVARVRQRAIEQAEVGEAVAEALFERAQGRRPLFVHVPSQRAGPEAPAARSNTTRPPATVRSTGVPRICRGGTRPRSASIPGASVPFSFSANSA